MAYVDLNPIRAKMAASVEGSEYTSIFERIHSKSHHTENKKENSSKPLIKFIGAERQCQAHGINFTLIDHLELVDWIGRIIREGKRGAISEPPPPALLGILGSDSETWLSLANDFGKDYHGAVGSLEELTLFAELRRNRTSPKLYSCDFNCQLENKKNKIEESQLPIKI